MSDGNRDGGSGQPSGQPVLVIVVLLNAALLAIAWSPYPLTWRYLASVAIGLGIGGAISVASSAAALNIGSVVGLVAGLGWFFHEPSRSMGVVLFLGAASCMAGSQVPKLFRRRAHNGSTPRPISGVTLLIELLVFLFFVLPFLLRR